MAHRSTFDFDGLHHIRGKNYEGMHYAVNNQPKFGGSNASGTSNSIYRLSLLV